MAAIGEEFEELNRAQLGTSTEVSRRLVKLEQSIERQDSKNQNVTYAVLFGAFLVLVAVAVQVIISDHIDRGRTDGLLERVHGVELKEAELRFTQDVLMKNLDAIRVRNPYLK